MALMDDVRAGMMAAMKNKDKVRKDALSALLAAMKSKMIDNKGVLTDDDAIAVVAREIKQLKETMDTAPESYVEVKEECAAKIAVLSEFMPKQMDVEEIKEVIRGVLATLGLEKPEAKQKGIIMKNLMPLVKGKADGKLVNEVLATFFA
ncbi:MAG: GatB/YqeY domain-containing protein [Oscillospiraceae bacterium]|nr:GatB/YqeY domain-containing protein [Oscillospiraceae bacterium]MBQ6850162.1 GatB/YqeY domain-containing protein [Oscillospiraceae bacterium]